MALASNPRAPKTPLTLVVAAAENHMIGARGDLPWRLRSDLKHFKALTLGHPVIMGRVTYQSIGRPLPGRDNLVISRSPQAVQGVSCFTSLAKALRAGDDLAVQSGAKALMIIGGGQIYRETLPLAARVELTRVAASIDGDTTFPPLLSDEWLLANSEDCPAGEGDDFAVRFETYLRRA